MSDRKSALIVILALLMAVAFGQSSPPTTQSWSEHGKAKCMACLRLLWS